MATCGALVTRRSTTAARIWHPRGWGEVEERSGAVASWGGAGGERGPCSGERRRRSGPPSPDRGLGGPRASSAGRGGGMAGWDATRRLWSDGGRCSGGAGQWQLAKWHGGGGGHRKLRRRRVGCGWRRYSRGRGGARSEGGGLGGRGRLGMPKFGREGCLNRVGWSRVRGTSPFSDHLIWIRRFEMYG